VNKMRHSRCELLLLEACSCGTGIVLESRGRGMFSVGSRYQATASKDVTVDTCVCVTVNCKVQSRSVSNGSINPVINPNPVYIRSIM
jgi:hypothetical protein